MISNDYHVRNNIDKFGYIFYYSNEYYYSTMEPSSTLERNYAIMYFNFEYQLMTFSFLHFENVFCSDSLYKVFEISFEKRIIFGQVIVYGLGESLRDNGGIIEKYQYPNLGQPKNFWNTGVVASACKTTNFCLCSEALHL